MKKGDIIKPKEKLQKTELLENLRKSLKTDFRKNNDRIDNMQKTDTINWIVDVNIDESIKKARSEK